MAAPKLIALCGYPQCGKSKLQEILARRWGAVAQDDARILRDAAKVLYGLDEDQVSTQEGKASEVEVVRSKVLSPERVRKAAPLLFAYDPELSDDGTVVVLGRPHKAASLISELSDMLSGHHKEERAVRQVRKFLGELGVLAEIRYGEMFVPDRILTALEKRLGGFEGVPPMTFGSVRRSQGKVYKERGGVVVEILRPGFDTAPNPFDDYDHSLIDASVRNDFDPERPEESAARLEAEALRVLTPLLGPPVAP